MTTHNLASLSQTIDTAFDNRDSVTINTKGEIRDAVNTALDLLDGGKVRVAERGADGNWTVNQWLKKAVLLVVPAERHGGRQGRIRFNPPGGTRFPPSSKAGVKTNSATPASALCRTLSCAAPPISLPMPS